MLFQLLLQYLCFNVYFVNLKENKRNIEIPRTIIFMLPIRLSDCRAVDLIPVQRHTCNSSSYRTHSIRYV